MANEMASMKSKGVSGQRKGDESSENMKNIETESANMGHENKYLASNGISLSNEKGMWIMAWLIIAKVRRRANMMGDGEQRASRGREAAGSAGRMGRHRRGQADQAQEREAYRVASRLGIGWSGHQATNKTDKRDIKTGAQRHINASAMASVRASRIDNIVRGISANMASRQAKNRATSCAAARQIRRRRRQHKISRERLVARGVNSRKKAAGRARKEMWRKAEQAAERHESMSNIKSGRHRTGTR